MIYYLLMIWMLNFLYWCSLRIKRGLKTFNLHVLLLHHRLQPWKKKVEFSRVFHSIQCFFSSVFSSLSLLLHLWVYKEIFPKKLYFYDASLTFHIHVFFTCFFLPHFFRFLFTQSFHFSSFSLFLRRKKEKKEEIKHKFWQPPFQ